ncbi:hypothetical protein L248_0485 [Schleiferilactobacillus shenzhenensis LY-73]|uniref:ROK family protein n=2 Tax=Schleiferilactobacillus shenzhenensis TaxID=1231337 RepID=U4TJ99_9LACO|nr:hypothetical protein L248_0485 [Schleiferilactobacillus shenzhenensis LY-73]
MESEANNMADLVVIDVGGTSIKYGVMHHDQLENEGSVATPPTLAEYYTAMTAIVDQARTKYQPMGVAISTPGAVNKKTGVIEGASAIPYIHNFPIVPELTRRFNLPISLENDANCAALAELSSGAGADVENMLFIVIGTGIGGSVIVNNRVIHGRHLFGGEFGYMLVDDKNTLSDVASPVHMARRYTARKADGKKYDGKTVFALADQGDALAKEETGIFFSSLARAIFNLSYAFDPDKVVLGGGVSQADWLIPTLTTYMQAVKEKVGIAPWLPELALAHYRSQANLMGAVVDFRQQYPATASPQ